MMKMNPMKYAALLSLLVMLVLTNNAIAQDYSLVAIGPPTGQSGSDHSTYLLSNDSFTRGQNLRCTFTGWLPSNWADINDYLIDVPIEWGGVLDTPTYVMIGGPFNFCSNPPGTYLFFEPEAMVRYWGADATNWFFAQPGDSWPTGGTPCWDVSAPVEDDFQYQWRYNTGSKANALQVRVTLGDTDGAMMEWKHVADASWKLLVDTRNTAANAAHTDVRVGFITYGGTLMIDDIVVENDGGVLLSENFDGTGGVINETTWRVSRQTTNGGGTLELLDPTTVPTSVDDWNLY